MLGSTIAAAMCVLRWNRAAVAWNSPRSADTFFGVVGSGSASPIEPPGANVMRDAESATSAPADHARVRYASTGTLLWSSVSRISVPD